MKFSWVKKFNQKSKYRLTKNKQYADNLRKTSIVRFRSIVTTSKALTIPNLNSGFGRLDL